MGLTGGFGARLLYVYGVYFTSANIAVLFEQMLPITTYVVSVIARIERFPKLSSKTDISRLSGVLITVLGAVVVCVGQSKKSSKGFHAKETGWKLILGYVFLTSESYGHTKKIYVSRE